MVLDTCAPRCLPDRGLPPSVPGSLIFDVAGSYLNAWRSPPAVLRIADDAAVVGDRVDGREVVPPRVPRSVIVDVARS